MLSLDRLPGTVLNLGLETLVKGNAGRPTDTRLCTRAAKHIHKYSINS